MHFDFYNNLSDTKKLKYNLMLETNYIILRCEECAFVETDEKGEDIVSVSWFYSLKHILKITQLNQNLYPQGSISGNRLYYELIRNYFNGTFPNSQEFNFIRQGLKNFLGLRRDDSATNRSYLFGSFFKVNESLGKRDSFKYRSIDVSLRHTAAALWIFIEESSINISPYLEESIGAFFNRTKSYLSRKDDWTTDGYKYFTLATIIITCGAIGKKFPNHKLANIALSIKSKCEEALFHNDCISQDLEGNYEWIVTDSKWNVLAKYQYFYSACALSRVPHLMYDVRIQSIIREMINNKVASEYGSGIPTHKLTMCLDRNKIKPDFGVTASILYFLWYSIYYEIGDSSWIEYCKENFSRLLDFCLNTYDKIEFNIFPFSENYATILLMPNNNCDSSRNTIIHEIIRKLKEAISTEIAQRKGKSSRLIDNIEVPHEFSYIKSIIQKWQFTEYWKEQNYRKYLDWGKMDWGKTGEFIGGLLKGYSQ